MKDLIVCDDEYIELAKKYKELGEIFDLYYLNFVFTLHGIAKNAMISGETHDNIVCLLTAFNSQNHRLSEATERAAKVCEDFINSIDEIESNLFKGD